MKPKVSILVLTYNRLAISSCYIPKLIENIGNIEFEVLIWDNGSEDGSYDWAYMYGLTNPNITQVIGHDKNIGMEAINKLARKAKGKYILKIDDDLDVPKNFAERLVKAYESVNEKKLLFLGWDMPWARTPKSGGNTFATRSGMRLYVPPRGKIIKINNTDKVLIHYDPRNWMMNGACRLSPRKDFLKIGGHPKGIIYGVDKHISARAADHGYWIGYFTSNDLVYHRGIHEDAKYRSMKDQELRRVNSPKDV